MMFAGIDGCRAGWIAVRWPGTEQGDLCLMSTSGLMEYALESPEKAVVLLDMPIGLMDRALAERKAVSGKGVGRACEAEARRILKTNHSRVFTPPSRTALMGRDRGEGSRLNRQELEVMEGVRAGISAQAWGIASKIREVDDLLQPLVLRGQPLPVREAHPEVCFWALNGGEPVAPSKKSLEGQTLRLNILEGHGMEARRILVMAREPGAVAGCEGKLLRKHALDDDLIDAMALALTSRLGHPSRLRSLPTTPEWDNVGLPMEMVYCEPAGFPPSSASPF